MKKITDLRCVTPGFLLVIVLLSSAAWAGVYQHGTVVRMHMGECMPEHHSFILAMSGAGPQNAPEACPEYTLVSEKVVYVIVGRSTKQLVPLADEIDFRLQNTELAVRIDDAKHESKFEIREMILRSQWDLVQKHIAGQMSSPVRANDENLPLRTKY